MKLRVKFSKNGAVKYVGHLDMMRYFQKAMRRANIDIAYSNGFSPHQIMSFAAPLGVGVTSDGEYFDMEANSISTEQDMIDRLNRAMAQGIVIHEMVLLEDTEKNAMASVAAADYTLTIRDGYTPDFSLSEAVERFQRDETVIYLKKTQKSEIELNLKDYVYSLSYDSCNAQINMLVDASSAGNIKPSMVMETLYHYFDKEPEEFAFSVHRNETYLRDANNELKPLSYVGTHF